MKAVIMAGGSGTRLWPLSRKNLPKQGQPLVGQETMVQVTYRRLRRGWPAKDILVSTNVAQFPVLRRQLPPLRPAQFILEPTRRDTAAAIGLVATYLWKRNRRQVMFTASSDHYFKEVGEYVRVVKAAGRAVAAHPQATVLVGVKPTFAHIGLGYIKMRRRVETIGGRGLFTVDRFIEKPDSAAARRFVTRWEYLWNIGVFMFRVDAMLDKFRRWLPRSHRLLMRMADAIGTSRERTVVRRLFPKMDRISIDYGIMEHDRHMFVIPAEVTWADIGSWREVYDMLAGQGGQNVVRGRHVHRDSRRNLVLTAPDKVVATVGLSDMIVVDTPDALLICPRDRAQDVKHLVADLERRRLHRHL